MKYKFQQNEPEFNGVYSRNNFPKIKDGKFVINLDKEKSIGTHWIALYVNGDNGILRCNLLCHNFGVEHIPTKIKKFTGNKNTIPNIYRT